MPLCFELNINKQRINMKTIIVASSIAIASMGLVACSSDASPAPTVTVTQQAPAPTQDDPPTTSMSNQDLYLLGLRSMNNRIINSSSDGELLEVGYSVCDVLEAGYTVDEVIAYLAREMAKDGGASETYVEAVGYIIGAAETALCPTATF
jgi:hypothetical protein